MDWTLRFIERYVATIDDGSYLSTGEVAKLMGCAPSTARKHLNAALDCVYREQMIGWCASATRGRGDGWRPAFRIIVKRLRAAQERAA
jgi:hypothetical protein